MKHSTVAGLLLGPAFTLAALLIGADGMHRTSSVHAEDDPAKPAYYTDKVQPILKANCYRCHGGMNRRGGLNMANKEDLIRGGHHGPAVVPGHPEQSWMVRLVRHEGPTDDPMNMPPDPKPKLVEADIAVIEAWIKAGAVVRPSGSAAPTGGTAAAGR